MRFEKISKYKDINIPLPQRKTKNSAGYDFVVAEDTIIYPYMNQFHNMRTYINNNDQENIDYYYLEEVSEITKFLKAKPTLVPTGVKAYLDEDKYLELSVRSSCPLKHWLVLANGVGIIDSDYVDNPDNEGHIYFQIINLFPYPIMLKRGDIIGQGIIKEYYKTSDDNSENDRVGGFGSTTEELPVK